MHRGRYSKAPPFVWRNDSKAILGVRQDTMRPSGFALGPLSPIEIPNDGEPHPLPLLKDVAGGLDGMLWVGNSGLALAEFGTKGKYYRPQHDDPTPTLRIVDGRRGKVLQTVPMRSEEQTSELQSLMRILYAVCSVKNKMK